MTPNIYAKSVVRQRLKNTRKNMPMVCVDMATKLNPTVWSAWTYLQDGSVPHQVVLETFPGVIEKIHLLMINAGFVIETMS